MVTAARKLGYADYEKIPADEFRHEIIQGEEYMTPAPYPDHQTVLLELGRLIGNHAAKHKLGRVFVAPTAVVLSRHDIVQPDAFFIRKARVSIIGKKNIKGPPDLVIEVTSLITGSIDRGPKPALYARSGVREYWLVDLSAQTVEVHEFGKVRRVRIYKEGQSFESALLPGLTVRLDDIF